jgi:hypothetical protein
MSFIYIIYCDKSYPFNIGIGLGLEIYFLSKFIEELLKFIQIVINPFDCLFRSNFLTFILKMGIFCNFLFQK